MVFHNGAEVNWYCDGEKMPGRFPAEQYKVKRGWQFALSLPMAEAPEHRRTAPEKAA